MYTKLDIVIIQIIFKNSKLKHWKSSSSWRNSGTGPQFYRELCPLQHKLPAKKKNPTKPPHTPKNTQNLAIV